MCAVASAAESVIVMMKSVATKPSRQRTKSFPCHRESRSLEHGDRALAVRALLRHAAVDRQRPEEREQHQDERRHRRERPGREEGDPRLVAERREVVDAGQTHDLPPGVLVVVLLLALVRAFDRLDLSFEEPAFEPAGRRFLWERRGRHSACLVTDQYNFSGTRRLWQETCQLNAIPAAPASRARAGAGARQARRGNARRGARAGR